MMVDWWHRQRHARRIDHYFIHDFAARLGARNEARMRADLGRCAACRAHYRRHLVAEAAMPGGEARARDRVWRGILAATGKPQPARPLGGSATGASTPSPFASSRTRLALAGALACALLVTIAGRHALTPRKTTADPVARGRLLARAPPPAIHVFRSVSERAAEPVGVRPIHARDGLLFAYTNPDPGLTHLMVFAIDQANAVHWYYPAYQRAGEDPIAVPILPGTTGLELGEEIRHDLPPGPIRIYALFLREPHRVLEIEGLVRLWLEEPRRPVSDQTLLPLPGSAQSSVLVEVEP